MSRVSNSELQRRLQNEWTRNLRPGVSKLSKEIYINLDMNKKANFLIASVVNKVFMQLVQHIKENNPVNATVEDSQKAVREVLPPSLSSLAMSEGLREVFLWGDKPFKFVPESKRLKMEEWASKQLALLTKKERNLLIRSYITGIKEVLNDSHPGASLDRRSIDYICLLLDNFSTEMVSKFKESNREKLTLEEAKKVTDMLPTELSHHAKAEAHKMMHKFEGRGLKFIPGATFSDLIKEMKSARSALERGKGKGAGPSRPSQVFAANGVEFKTGVMSILEEIHPGAELELKTHKMICQNLDGVKRTIFERMGGKGVKTVDDVKKAVQDALPPLLAQHAAAEGEKMLIRYTKGDVYFKLRGVKTEMEIAQLARKKQKVIATDFDFSVNSGVAAVTRVTFPGANLHKSAHAYISTNLKTFLDAVIEKVKESQVKDVSVSDVSSAVSAIINTPVLAQHARSEGQKSVNWYEMKGFKFDVPKSK